MPEINADVSKQLAKDLTENHPVTVYAMTKVAGKLSSGSKITSTKVKAVTNQACEIAYVTCRGDLCEMHTASYPLNPPLQSADEFPKRLDQIHNQVCAPKASWLVTSPLALMILITCSALSYGTLYVGVDGMVDALAQAPRLEDGVNTIFGSAHTFGIAVTCSWCFLVIAHGIEATIALQYCTHRLKLNAQITSLWALLIFITGFPVYWELKDLVKVQKDHDKKK
jgi:hypothetical protein